MSTLYIQAEFGISGDMLAGALIDLGADEKKLKETLYTLNLEGVDYKITRKTKSALQVCDFDVILSEDNHDHDMDYLYGSKDKEAHEEAKEGDGKLDLKTIRMKLEAARESRLTIGMNEPKEELPEIKPFTPPAEFSLENKLGLEEMEAQAALGIGDSAPEKPAGGYLYGQQEVDAGAADSGKGSDYFFGGGGGGGGLKESSADSGHEEAYLNKKFGDSPSPFVPKAGPGPVNKPISPFVPKNDSGAANKPVSPFVQKKEEPKAEEVHEHTHEQPEHAHEEHHEHEHHEHEHEHHHTGLKEIEEIINGSKMSSKAKKTALKIFDCLAEAEAAVHGKPKEEVHFHEAGAKDSIADVCAIAICLDLLKVTKVIVPYVMEGHGTVNCQHGVLPVPVPAVTKLSELYGVNIRTKDFEGELVTPTGAAFVAACNTSSKLPAGYKVVKTGLGCGKRDYNPPSILRAMLIDEVKESKKSESPESVFKTLGLELGTAAAPAADDSLPVEVREDGDTIIKLETTIDDSNGEILGHAMDKLFEIGVRDCYFFPVYMKKNRPGYQLNIIVDEDLKEKAEDIVASETTTIGIREIRCSRRVWERKTVETDTPYGKLKCKEVDLGNGRKRIYPEYESVKALAEANNMAYPDMYAKAIAAAEALRT